MCPSLRNNAFASTFSAGNFRARSSAKRQWVVTVVPSSNPVDPRTHGGNATRGCGAALDPGRDNPVGSWFTQTPSAGNDERVEARTCGERGGRFNNQARFGDYTPIR